MCGEAGLLPSGHLLGELGTCQGGDGQAASLISNLGPVFAPGHPSTWFLRDLFWEAE